ncbi:MAG: hypothetical protein MJ070_05155 [Lachnospiraceae bacterium]|nr:hypothetical protein [Lachnospiraceae bacterium]
MPRVGKDVFGFSNMRDIDKSEFMEKTMEQNNTPKETTKMQWWEILFAILLPIPCLIYSVIVYRKRLYAKKLLLLSIVIFIVESVIAVFIPAIMIWLLGPI